MVDKESSGIANKSSECVQHIWENGECKQRRTKEGKEVRLNLSESPGRTRLRILC